jgi:hypothetical protein
MVGGIGVGIALVTIYGWSLLSVGFWLGFGLLVGALGGGISFLIYQAIRALTTRTWISAD